jgi:hypothetical protein
MHFISRGEIASIFRAVRTLRHEKENFEKFKLLGKEKEREGGERKWQEGQGGALYLRRVTEKMILLRRFACGSPGKCTIGNRVKR